MTAVAALVPDYVPTAWTETSVAEPTNLDIMVELTRVGEQLRGLTTSVNEKLDHQGTELASLRTDLAVERERIRQVETAIAKIPTEVRVKALEEKVGDIDRKSITWPQATALFTALLGAATFAFAVFAK